MKKIVVASKNPVKIKAALHGFQKMFPGEQFEVEGIEVVSGVSVQPKNSAEILQGAWNRAHNASTAQPDGDFWVGIENGIEDTDADMESFAWVVVKCSNGKCGKGRSLSFFLPTRIAELIRSGKELGEADDIVFGRTNSKQANGSIGILTDDAIDRTAYCTDAVMCALIPFKNEHLY